MDDAVRDRLTGLVQEHGVELLQDPARLEAFLRDLCPGSKAEIYCLVAGIREGAVNELRGADPGRSPEAARDHVIQRLSRDLRFDEEAATWTVDTVIAALDAAAQDTPVSDDLDHVGYCASCHAMMSSSADLETCSECGAALIDVRQVAREAEDISPAASVEVGQPEVSRRHRVEAGTVDVRAVAAPAALDERRFASEALATPTDETSSESPAVSSTTSDDLSRPAISDEVSSETGVTLPARRRWGTKHSAIAFMAVVALAVALALVVASFSDSPGLGPYSESEMRSAFSINDVDYLSGGSRGWAVGDDGVILVSENNGETWMKQASGTDEDLVQVVAFSEQICSVWGSSIILSTSDSGDSWRRGQGEL